MGKRKKGSNKQQSGVSFKRQRQDNAPPSLGGIAAGLDANGYLDPNTGQRGAFPGLDNSAGDFYGPANDGMDYLRMVRSEAKAVPSLLVSASAPPPPKARSRKKKPLLPPQPTSRSVVTSHDDVVLDYDDPPAEPTSAPEPIVQPEPVPEPELELKRSPTPEPVPDDPNFVFAESTYVSLLPSPPRPTAPPWHDALLTRFRHVREALHSKPPTSASLDSSQRPPALLPAKFGPKWLYLNPPTPRQLWGLDQHRTLALINVAGRIINQGTRTVRRGIEVDITRWCWGLLVRVDETMTADETYTVRELAKGALKQLGRLKKLQEEEDAEIEEFLAKDVEEWHPPDSDEEEEVVDEVSEEIVNEDYLAEAALQETGDGVAPKIQTGEIDPENIKSEMEEGELDELAAAPELDSEASSRIADKIRHALAKARGKNVTNRTPPSADPLADSTYVPTSPRLIETTEPAAATTEAPTVTTITIDELTAEDEVYYPPINIEAVPPTPSPPSHPLGVVNPSGGDSCGGVSTGYDKVATMATLDMIVAIVGDFFGQRDLLEERWAMG